MHGLFDLSRGLKHVEHKVNSTRKQQEHSRSLRNLKTDVLDVQLNYASCVFALGIAEFFQRSWGKSLSSVMVLMTDSKTNQTVSNAQSWSAWERGNA